VCVHLTSPSRLAVILPLWPHLPKGSGPEQPGQGLGQWGGRGASWPEDMEPSKREKCKNDNAKQKVSHGQTDVPSRCRLQQGSLPSLGAGPHLGTDLSVSPGSGTEEAVWEYLLNGHRLIFPESSLMTEPILCSLGLMEHADT